MLYYGGHVDTFADQFIPNQSQATPTPSACGVKYGLLLQGGFGKVWNRQSRVREHLDCATTGEMVSPESDIATFQKGFMVSAHDTIFVLGSDNAKAFTDVIRWDKR